MTDNHRPVAWREKVAVLLDDPVVRLVMRRDGLTHEDILDVMSAVRETVLSRANGKGKKAFASAC